MGTQVLKGSTGIYKPSNPEITVNSSFNFTVTQDTCLESKKLPIRFQNGVESIWIDFTRVGSWVNKLTRDY